VGSKAMWIFTIIHVKYIKDKIIGRCAKYNAFDIKKQLLRCAVVFSEKTYTPIY
jgi:hypothetical protein